MESKALKFIILNFYCMEVYINLLINSFIYEQQLYWSQFLILVLFKHPVILFFNLNMIMIIKSS